VIISSLRQRLQQGLKWTPASTGIQVPALEGPEQAAARRPDTQYADWIERFDEVRERDRTAIEEHVRTEDLPTLIVIIAFDRISAGQADAVVRHLQAQLLQRWRAILWFDESCPRDIVEQQVASALDDCRIAVIRAPSDDLPIPPGTKADCILLAAGSVLLRKHALYVFATAAARPGIRLVYSDEDALDSVGQRYRPIFKPSFSPELARHTNYFGPCVLVRLGSLSIGDLQKELLDPGGDFRSLLEGAWIGPLKRCASPSHPLPQYRVTNWSSVICWTCGSHAASRR
jgi:O-antigen biosynthesis protein